ncbi:NAD(P)H-dependent oxidoreductase [Streptomyces sp. XM4193]|uniref:CE1759 family FMN reductase n=1 Tax=Streptomyces sp. XM4193 TaxID=2929782 RepID=UPI001FF9BA37|nr:CE1759 family FMN reductase [Streptomyces sp. XM4193]MCK1795688.1 NAD(P)H-dependent oxidoreductase [Streptomyces sp. XM4193]
MEPVTLTVVSAGLGKPSSTRLLADRLTESVVRRLDTETGELAPAHTQPGADASRVRVHVVELRDLATEIAHHLVTGFPGPALREALESVERADALIAVTPIFAASYSGLFKSFFDVLDREALDGTPVLLGATGGTARHSLALEYALRPLFAHLRAAPVPTAVFAASEDWAGGDARTADLPSRIDRAAGELAALVGAAPAAGKPRSEGAEHEEVVPFADQLAALGVR